MKREAASHATSECPTAAAWSRATVFVDKRLTAFSKWAASFLAVRGGIYQSSLFIGTEAGNLKYGWIIY
jgi:hypothetical protein